MSQGDGGLRVVDWFAGAGGATQGAAAVPEVVPVLAANHWDLAVDTHSANFPDVEHLLGDVQDIDVTKHPYGELFWASPECTTWTTARGKQMDFDVQPGLFGDPQVDKDTARSRALMQDVPRYLEGMAARGRPVLAGVVENVVEVRAWTLFDVWRRRIEQIGYRTRLVALNSAHARPVRTAPAPQSRDRLYLAYWHTSLGRDPDWDKWLRPDGRCPSCEQDVTLVQVWRRRGVDMGRHGAQYDYVCPKVSCRGARVEPTFVPAAAAIDWSLRGTPIGQRAKPLAPKTMARIAAGLRRHARPVVLDDRPGVGSPPLVVTNQWSNRARTVTEPLPTSTTATTTAMLVPPLLVPAGGTWNDAARPVGEPMRTRTTRDSDAVLTVPLLVPVEGRDGKTAAPTAWAMRTQTGRAETGLLVPPIVTELRGGGSTGHGVDQPLATVTAGGNHHGLVVPPLVMRNNTPKGDPGQMVTPASQALRTVTASGTQSVLTWATLFAYDSGTGDLARPMPTQTTVAGDALLTAAEWDTLIDACEFRMLQPHETKAAMAFDPGYIVRGSKRDQVRQLGGAVTPPVAEVLVSALVETITGHALDLAA